MRGFLKRVSHTAKTRALWEKESRLLVAVSGGPDSLCLLDTLFLLSKKYPLSLHIAHMNYRLRGKESDQDEVLVRQQAAAYGIPCTVLRSRKKLSSEAEFRQARYVFFEKLRKRKRCDVIAVAHTEDDQAETFLLRLLRGAGIDGLGAMQPKNGFVVRPFLFTPRADVLRFLTERTLNPREDSSNKNQNFLRNRVRLTLLPFLEQSFQPNVKKLLARNAALIAEDAALIETLVPPLVSLVISQRNVSFSRTELLSHPLPIIRRHLRAILKPFFEELPPSRSLVDEMIKTIRSAKNKPQRLETSRLKLERKGDKVTLLF